MREKITKVFLVLVLATGVTGVQGCPWELSDTVFPHDYDVGPFPVTIVNKDLFEEYDRWVWTGDYIPLFNKYREIVDVFYYRYKGERRIEYSFDEGKLRVNGRVVGLFLRAGEISEELVSKHKGRIETILLRGDGIFDKETVESIEKSAGKKLVLQLDVHNLFEFPNFDKLLRIRDKICYLELRGGRQWRNLKLLSLFHSIESLYIQGDVKKGGLRPLFYMKQLRELNLFEHFSKTKEMKYLSGLKNLRKLNLRGSKIVDDEGLSYLSGMKKLRWLNLYETNTTDKGLAYLSGLKQLYFLNLGKTEITDKGLAHLSGLKNLKWLDLSKTAISSKGLAQIAKHQQLERLFLMSKRVKMAGMAHIGKLKNLQELRFWHSGITGESLKHLSKLTKLRKLVLSERKVGDDGLKHLAGLKELRNLILYSTKVTDSGLKYLSKLKGLESLKLHHAKLEGGGLKHLTGLKNLKEIFLSYTKVSDEGLKHLSQLENLRVVDLNRTQISDQGLYYLSRLKNLEKLDIRHTKVTDKGLSYLSGMKNLNYLRFDSEKITLSGLRHLWGLKQLRTLDIGGMSLLGKDLTNLYRLKQLRLLYGTSIWVTQLLQKIDKGLPKCWLRPYGQRIGSYIGPDGPPRKPLSKALIRRFREYFKVLPKGTWQFYNTEHYWNSY